jgi:hypothetical protein
MADFLNLFSKKEKPKEQETSQPLQNDIMFKLYRIIINRYRDKIEEYETKSITELKELVKPKDPTILEIKEAITSSFKPYVYAQNFYEASKMAFAKVKTFQTVSVPVPFWLTFAEMQEIMAGDEIDKSIFLCSLLRSLGSESAKVFITENKKSYVLFQCEGKTILADHSKDQLVEFSSATEALESLKSKILYAFNDLEYEDFEDPGKVF